MKKLTKHIHLDLQDIPINLMRYKDIGDWIIDDTKNRITFTLYSGDMGNTDYNLLVLLHELVESYLCYRRGIKGEVVDKWDKDHPDHPEPGRLPLAPYHTEHMIATRVEELLGFELGVKWKAYEKAIQNTMKKYKKGTHA